MEHTDSGKSEEKKTRTITYEDGTTETFELRQISDEELQQVLAEHKKWLVSEGKEGKRANLRKTDLSGRDLQKTVLNKANLYKAEFVGSNLRKVEIENGNIQKANFYYANLQKANLSLSDFRKADLSNSNIWKGQLWKINLQKAELWSANLRKANLNDANLGKANLGIADIENSDLKGTNLQNANLWGSNFSKTRAFQADFNGADLRDANFIEAKLYNANFRSANLSAANFENANVSGLQYDKKTLCKGIRVSSCHGSAMFKAFAQHQDFIEELRVSGIKGKALYHIWNIFADCGRTPWRWMGWSAGFMLLFALLFWPTPSCFPDWFLNFTNNHGAIFQQTADAYSREPMTFGSALYFSVVTFTTLGFGDVIAANGMARFLVVLEVILGYVMLGGLISIFATLITRRS